MKTDYKTHSDTFLTVPELAELLHVNEKKIYKLAGEGDIPGTKITGKWIFPRHMIEDWITENSHGGALSDRLIIAGSDDRLLAQLCNQTAIELQHSALLSYSPVGTRHGLRMLDTRRADACFINWGSHEGSARRHLGLLRGYKNHSSWVLVRCFQRSQGLVLARKFDASALDVKTVLSDSSLRWAHRNTDSGTERLLEDICVTNGIHFKSLPTATLSNTERSAIGAVNTGNADVTCGTLATANEFQLPFLPIANVSIDMIMTRRTYFRTLTQRFLSMLNSGSTLSSAAQLGGYTLPDTLDVLTVE